MKPASEVFNRARADTPGGTTVDEHDWLTSTDPAAMLHYLDPGNARVGKLGDPGTSHLWTDRRLRLFACACCRQVWHLLVDEAPCGRCHAGVLVHTPQGRPGPFPCPDCNGTGRVNRSRRAVEVAELYAEGRATDEELEAASDSMATVGRSATFEYAPAWACHREISYGVWALVGAGREWPEGQRAIQADLLRCIFGNPFRPVRVRDPLTCSRGHDDWALLKKDSYPVPLSACLVCHEMGPPWPDVERGKAPAWLTPAVVSLARAIHADRDWAALPVLADLLEEAGCANKDILMHLRGWVRCPNCLSGEPARPDLWGFCDQCRGMRWRARGGTHARGCHALDLLLGKE